MSASTFLYLDLWGTVRLTRNALSELGNHSLSLEVCNEEHVIGIELARECAIEDFVLGAVQNGSGLCVLTLCCHRKCANS